MTLADAGYEVITAANGKQALASLAETRPDVIVTDMMMPILDGPGLLAALAANPAHRDIPVILMSALDRAAAAKLVQGQRAFLGTLLLGPELHRVLERVLARRRTEHPSCRYSGSCRSGSELESCGCMLTTSARSVRMDVHENARTTRPGDRRQARPSGGHRWCRAALPATRPAARSRPKARDHPLPARAARGTLPPRHQEARPDQGHRSPHHR